MKNFSAIISKIVGESIKNTFQADESEKPAARLIVIGDQELKYGSLEHLEILKNTAVGLEHVRSLYPKGSSTRHIYSGAYQRIRTLISKLESI